MKSYTLKEAAKIMDIQPICEDDIFKSQYKLLTTWLLNYGFVRYGRHMLSKSTNNVFILTDEFKNMYPHEAKLYFEERWVYNDYYQLRITEEGVKHLTEFVLNILKKELFK